MPVQRLVEALHRHCYTSTVFIVLSVLYHVPQYVLQNATIPVVVGFPGGVDSDDRIELNSITVIFSGSHCDSLRDITGSEVTDTVDIKNFCAI